MATFYFGQSSKDNKWYFRLRANNNEIILASTEGYNSKQGCLVGITSVKTHAPHEQYYKRFTGSGSKYYFTLHASNGEPIGRSEGYNSAQGRDNGIDVCKREAASADVVELNGPF